MRLGGRLFSGPRLRSRCGGLAAHGELPAWRAAGRRLRADLRAGGFRGRLRGLDGVARRRGRGPARRGPGPGRGVWRLPRAVHRGAHGVAVRRYPAGPQAVVAAFLELAGGFRFCASATQEAAFAAAASLDPFNFLAQTILPAIYEQRQRIKILYTSSVDPLWSDFITASYKDWIEQNLNLDYQKLGIPEDLANQLLAGWISSLIENWITQDDPVPCKQFSKTFLNLVSSPLTSFAAYDSPAGPSNKIVIA